MNIAHQNLLHALRMRKNNLHLAALEDLNRRILAKIRSLDKPKPIDDDYNKAEILAYMGLPEW